MNEEIPTGYELSRQWFDFAFENPDKISPNHTAMYFFAVEHCNRLGWKRKFGFPSTMAMEAMGVKSYNTYKKTLDDLIDWGFFELIEKSKNQYSSNIIALSKNDKAHAKALDKALTKHVSKQSESKESIYKQVNHEPSNNETTPAYAEGDTPYELSKYLMGKIIEYKPNHRFVKKPPDLQKWAQEADRMSRIDGRDLREAGRVVQWVFDKHISNGSFDWRDNIQSIEKLRKHYDKLESQSKTKRGVSDEFIDSLYK